MPATRKFGWSQLLTAPSMASVSVYRWSYEFCLLHTPIKSQESIFSDVYGHTRVCSKHTKHYILLYLVDDSLVMQKTGKSSFVARELLNTSVATRHRARRGLDPVARS